MGTARRQDRAGRTPEECLAREITEETQWKVTTGPILDSWMYHIATVEKDVFIVTYGCCPDTTTEPVLSHEHKEVGLFGEYEVPALNMPDGYKRSIATGSPVSESTPPNWSNRPWRADGASRAVPS
ncbi:hypothetical protein GCM10012275_13060 [Longimycelium tulufanense]|uniref:Nudix hydrolase domain-containing protein n=1 Tax=Longimycelium tulufanense TaxID=907463 RepID=A0A8J3CAC5_9PSEU|nr:NUDIX domain-containing protein [Longimycelium tulufanense]GGM43478.1 hypothetical protein GCM10012275_13060 [Longimycelium tulufanense]